MGGVIDKLRMRAPRRHLGFAGVVIRTICREASIIVSIATHVIIRRTLRFAVVALSPTLVLIAGCGDEESDATVTLRVANWGSPAVVSDFLQLERQLIREFESAHPGVRVRVEQVPGWGQYAPKVLMMHASDSIPDVLHLDASSGAVFIDNGVVQDVMPFAERDTAFKLDDYFEEVLTLLRRGERLYGVPLDFTPMMMFYNRTLFDQARVPYPKPGWTWDDFLKKARRLTVQPPGAKSPTQFGMFFENVMPFWILWLWTGGGDVLDPTGTRASGQLDGPESIAAMQFLIDLMFKHHVAPTPRETKAAGVDLFRTGRAAMDIKGHWMMIDYRAEGIDFGVAPLPVKEGVPRKTVVYASGLAISTKARHPDLAWEYIKFITSRDIQVRRVSSGLAISGNKRAAETFAGYAVEDAFLAEVPYARPPWGASVEAYPFIEELGREMMEDLLHGEGRSPLQEEMRRTAKLIDAALAAE